MMGAIEISYLKYSQACTSGWFVEKEVIGEHTHTIYWSFRVIFLDTSENKGNDTLKNPIYQ